MNVNFENAFKCSASGYMEEDTKIYETSSYYLPLYGME
jgi:hypothetical protein